MIMSELLCLGIFIEIVVVLQILSARAEPQREGTMPHCARCDYNLTGLASNRCPECGAEINEGSIAYGERIRPPWVKWSIGVGVVLPLVMAGGWAWRYDWHRVFPMTWLLRDCQSSDTATKDRALWELRRRWENKSLSQDDYRQWIDVGLAEYAQNRTPFPLVHALPHFLAEGRMSESQKTTFGKLVGQQSCELEMQVRPKVLAGGSIPVRIQETWLGGGSHLASVEVDYAHTIQLDGINGRELVMPRDLESEREDYSRWTTWKTSVIPFSRWSEGVPLGEHRLSTIATIRVRAGEKPALIYEGRIPLHADFQVLAPGSPDAVRLIGNPSLKPSILKAIQPGRPVPDQHLPYVRIPLQVTDLPVNVAFEVFARVGDDEYPFGKCQSLAKRETLSSYWGLTGRLPDQTRSFDLVFRASPKVALETVDILEIWQGELVYLNMQIDKEFEYPSERPVPQQTVSPPRPRIDLTWSLMTAPYMPLPLLPSTDGPPYAAARPYRPGAPPRVVPPERQPQRSASPARPVATRPAFIPLKTISLDPSWIAQHPAEQTTQTQPESGRSR